MNKQSIKKTIFIYIGIALLLIVGFLAYDNGVFRVKSSDPDFGNQTVPSSISFMRFSFSQPLESVGEISLGDTFITEEAVTIDENELTIQIDPQQLQMDSEYTLVINDVESKWFGFSIDQLEYTFTAEYTDYNDLSEDQQKAQVDMSDSYQIEDPFLNNQFPIFKDDFRIKAINNYGEIVVDVAFYEEIPDYDNGGKISQVSNQRAEELRKKALEVIRQHDGTPKDYKIQYSNRYLNKKYGAQE